jgi:hypothetical protein
MLRILVASCVVFVGVAVGNQTAHAESGDSWALTLSTDPATNIGVGPAGDVAIQTFVDQTNSIATVQGVSSSGTVEWSAPRDGKFVAASPDPGQSPFVYDQTGNTYWIEYGGTGIQVVASRSGHQLWNYVIAGSTINTQRSLVLGANGLLYVHDDIAVGTNQNLDQLVALDPTTGLAQFTVGIPEIYDFGQLAQLFSYAGGLVSTDPFNIYYLSFAGQVTRTVPLPPQIVPGRSSAENQITGISANGQIYITTVDYSCFSTSPNNVTIVSPSGSSSFLQPIPASANNGCGGPQYGGQALPLPDGGFLYSGTPANQTGVSVFNADGSLRWQNPSLSSIYKWEVDTSGALVGFGSTSVMRTVAPPNNSYQSALVAELNPNNGSIVTQGTITSANDPQPYQLYPSSLSLGVGQAFITGWLGNSNQFVAAKMWAFALPGVSEAYPTVAIRQLAAGAGPVITNLSVNAPSSSDALLTRGLSISGLPSASGSPVAKYQYGWAPGTGVAVSPTTPIQKCNAASPCTVSFVPTAPSSTWTLFGRAIAKNGQTSAWSGRTVQTPPAPILVALGDSLTSGHHRDSALGTTNCNDPAFGYPARVFANFEAQLPTAWKSTNYFNYAYSGFGLAQMQSGGGDACGNVQPASLFQATAQLMTYAGSWNQVLISAGIDDTNWGSVIGTVVSHSDVGLNPLYGAKSCKQDLKAWSGNTAAVQTSVTQGVASVVQALKAADPSFWLDWIGYYNIAGTGLPGIGAPVVKSACQGAIKSANAVLAAAIQRGLPGQQYQWIDSDKVLHMNDPDLQGIYASDIFDQVIANPSVIGWPHPNQAGAAAIAGLIKKY